jgi:hypothetical protein
MEVTAVVRRNAAARDNKTILLIAPLLLGWFASSSKPPFLLF